MCLLSKGISRNFFTTIVYISSIRDFAFLIIFRELIFTTTFFANEMMHILGTFYAMTSVDISSMRTHFCEFIFATKIFLGQIFANAKLFSSIKWWFDLRDIISLHQLCERKVVLAVWIFKLLKQNNCPYLINSQLLLLHIIFANLFSKSNFCEY